MVPDGVGDAVVDADPAAEALPVGSGGAEGATSGVDKGGPVAAGGGGWVLEVDIVKLGESLSGVATEGVPVDAPELAPVALIEIPSGDAVDGVVLVEEAESDAGGERDIAALGPLDRVNDTEGVKLAGPDSVADAEPWPEVSAEADSEALITIVRVTVAPLATDNEGELKVEVDAVREGDRELGRVRL